MLKNSYLNGNLSLQSLVEGYLRLGLVCCAMCTAFELRFCRDIKFPTSAEMRKCKHLPHEAMSIAASRNGPLDVLA